MLENNMKVVDGKELIEALILVSFNAGLTPTQARAVTVYISEKFGFNLTIEDFIKISNDILLDNPHGDLK